MVVLTIEIKYDSISLLSSQTENQKGAVVMIAYRVLRRHEEETVGAEVVNGLVVQRAGQEDDICFARDPYPFDTVIIGDHANGEQFTMVSIHGAGVPDVINHCTIRQSRNTPRPGYQPQLVLSMSDGKDDEIALVHVDGFSVQGTDDHVGKCSDRGRSLRRTTYEDGSFPCPWCETLIDQRTFVHPDEGDTHSFYEIRVGDFIAGVYNWAEGTSCLDHEYLITMKPGSKCRLERRGQAFLLEWRDGRLTVRPFETADAKIVQLPDNPWLS